jgi:hypothetical protein
MSLHPLATLFPEKHLDCSYTPCTFQFTTTYRKCCPHFGTGINAFKMTQGVSVEVDFWRDILNGI